MPLLEGTKVLTTIATHSPFDQIWFYRWIGIIARKILSLTGGF